MKKHAKIVLIVTAALILTALLAVYMLTPVTLKSYAVTKGEASLYFIEQGYVKDPELTEILTETGGKILDVKVTEGDTVNAGDLICTLDTKDYELDIKRLESVNEGYQAQINNLNEQEKKQNDSLVSDRQALVSELNSINAQQNTNTGLETDQIKLKDEQTRLQNIIIAQNEKDLAVVSENFEKIKALYDIGSIPLTDYEDAQNKLNQAQSALESSRQQLSIIQSGIIEGSSDEYYDAMKASINAQISGIDKTVRTSYNGAMISYYESLIEEGNINIDKIKNQISDGNITSSVTGTVETLYATDVNILNPMSPVVVIRNTGDKELEVFAATQDAAQVNVGDSVVITLKRQPDDVTINGSVTKIDDYAIERLSAMGVLERRVKITVLADNDENDYLKPGYEADLTFTTYTAENALTVPKSAVFEQDGEDFVWIIKNGVLDTQNVTKGMELRTQHVITSGLNEGDIILPDCNQDNLRKGMKVKSE
ncbi:MAG: HlyD family efflux transporter periplasmic adaptor subunit [Clostridiales bacterium]|jgi:HlyD family secretion protein|nr:HlyD family efflux transporter periplasmic adaptor subunit [Clostridiales bacterium]